MNDDIATRCETAIANGWSSPSNEYYQRRSVEHFQPPNNANHIAALATTPPMVEATPSAAQGQYLLRGRQLWREESITSWFVVLIRPANVGSRRGDAAKPSRDEETLLADAPPTNELPVFVRKLKNDWGKNPKIMN
jgi:hypothetical protein